MRKLTTFLSVEAVNRRRTAAQRPRRVLPMLRLSDLAAALQLWHARSRQRQALGHLAELSDHLLKDIGLCREQALREAAKPFWRR